MQIKNSKCHTQENNIKYIIIYIIIVLIIEQQNCRDYFPKIIKKKISLCDAKIFHKKVRVNIIYAKDNLNSAIKYANINNIIIKKLIQRSIIIIILKYL